MGGSDNSDHYLVMVKMNVRIKRSVTTRLTINDIYDITYSKYTKRYKRFESEITSAYDYPHSVISMFP